MKHLLLTGLCLTFLSSQLQASVRIAGKFKNPVSDSIFITTAEGKPIAAGRHHKKHGFAFELRVDDGLYYIGDGNEHTEMYLRDGFDLHLTLNTKTFDETVQWKGTGASENNYLAKRLLLEEYTESMGNIWTFVKRDETGYLRYCDSMHAMSTELLNRHRTGMHVDFANTESVKFDIVRRSRWHEYESMHGYIRGIKDFKVSKSFPDAFAGLDLNMESLCGVWEYEDLLSSYLSKKTVEDSSKDFYTDYLLNLESAISSIKIRQTLAYSFGTRWLQYAKNMDTCYLLLARHMTDPVKIKEVTDKYERIKKLKKGMPAHGFAFADKNGSSHSLESLKGRLVYIDVWATWCGPCREENPFWEKLQDSLAGTELAFVSICVWDKKPNWLAYLEKKQPKGLHLFVENQQDRFLSDYVIQGVPTYILIDKSGNIISANAKRPSGPDTLSYLRSLISE